MAAPTGKQWQPHYPCDYYKQEYKDCTSLGNRFHSYYVFGEKPDCSQWQKDFKACTTWMQTRTEDARQELLKTEDRHLRQKYYTNPVWQHRVSPPKEWYLPLQNPTQRPQQANATSSA